jgi:DNA polymerase-3 subunit epsilon
MSWQNAPMLAWDTESTGVDVETARIVTAALVWIQPGKPVTTKHLLINPGVEIPQQATDVHGITTARAQAEGREPGPALDEIADNLADAVKAGWPLVGMNCCYDVTLLDRELRRHGLALLADRIGGPIAPVIDALVLDRAVRPGKFSGRKLTQLCEIWGVRIDGAHDAHFDALAAARVAWMIAHRTPRVAGMSLAVLHAFQVEARVKQQAEMKAWFDLKRIEHDGFPPEWPLVPFESRQLALATP